MRKWGGPAFALAIAVLTACSNLPTGPNNVVSIGIIVPDSLSLAIGDSLTLEAVALNVGGDTVADAPIRWFTPDTALVDVDSLSGLIVAKSDSGSARVQASVGTLHSSIVTIPLHAVDTTSSDTTSSDRRATP